MHPASSPTGGTPLRFPVGNGLDGQPLASMFSSWGKVICWVSPSDNQSFCHLVLRDSGVTSCPRPDPRRRRGCWKGPSAGDLGRVCHRPFYHINQSVKFDQSFFNHHYLGHRFFIPHNRRSFRITIWIALHDFEQLVIHPQKCSDVWQLSLPALAPWCRLASPRPFPASKASPFSGPLRRREDIMRKIRTLLLKKRMTTKLTACTVRSL